jgi:hypothetical protein
MEKLVRGQDTFFYGEANSSFVYYDLQNYRTQLPAKRNWGAERNPIEAGAVCLGALR